MKRYGTARELLAKYGVDWIGYWPWSQRSENDPRVWGPQTRGKCLHCEDVYDDAAACVKTLGEMEWGEDGVWHCTTSGCDGIEIDFWSEGLLGAMSVAEASRTDGH